MNAPRHDPVASEFASQRADGAADGAVSADQSNHHYAQDSRIFELFLCGHLKYSSGLFQRDDDDLDRAQEQKMHMIAGMIDARPGARVLDIGCGWGSLTLFLAREYQCEVIGITPSPSQHSFIERRAAEQGVVDQIRIVLDTIERAEIDSRAYDAVTMLGSITHMPDKQAVVDKAWQALRRRGCLYLSESCFRNRKIYEEFNNREGTAFIREEIFGWGELLPLSEYVRFVENAGFSLAGLRDLTRDYFKTIEHWRANTERNADRIDAIEPGHSERLLRYFDLANAGWGYTTKHYAIGARKQR